MENSPNNEGKNKEMMQLVIAMVLGGAIIAGAILFLR